MENCVDHQNFSVLLSVYYKEDPIFFDKCLNSIYNQTIKANEWVIVKDGIISNDLQKVIDKYKNYDYVNIKEIELSENKGLGIALSIGILHCNYELIARMDTDDIAMHNRFELQLMQFAKNPDLDLCGGQILEFDLDENIPIGERRVPLTLDQIIRFQKKRSAFNHMTVMFKKSKVLQAGNYKNVPLMEDDMLWVNMLLSGANCLNIDKYLCLVRTNKDMIARRGGLQYYKKYKNARKLIYDTGFITKKQYFSTNFIQFWVCILPSFIRKFIFFHFIHKKLKLPQETQ